jgi:hypothetical protein
MTNNVKKFITLMVCTFATIQIVTPGEARILATQKIQDNLCLAQAKKAQAYQRLEKSMTEKPKISNKKWAELRKKRKDQYEIAQHALLAAQTEYEKNHQKNLLQLQLIAQADFVQKIMQKP